MRGRSAPVSLILTAVLGTALAAVPAQAGGGGDPGPTTYEIEASRYLNDKGEKQVSMRYFPDEITVHEGDLLHFTSAGAHTATLLPVGEEPGPWRTAHATKTTTKPTPPYALIHPDPDETAAGSLKLNPKAMAPTWPSFICGTSGSPCGFNGSGVGTEGVLNSGGATAASLDFSVEVLVPPGNDFWVVDLVNPTMKAKITVVDTETAADTPQQLSTDNDAQQTADAQKATTLYNEYATKKVFQTVSGVRVWTAWAGMDDGAVSLRYMFPLKHTIKKGQKVKWKFDQLVHQGHSVTFPPAKGEELAATIPTIQCDTNGDSGAGSGAADDDQQLAQPPFCLKASHLELDIPASAAKRKGDRIVSGAADFEHSGINGGQYGYAKKAHTVKFSALSADGFRLTSATFPFMSGTVVVKAAQ